MLQTTNNTHYNLVAVKKEWRGDYSPLHESDCIDAEGGYVNGIVASRQRICQVMHELIRFGTTPARREVVTRRDGHPRNA